MQEILKFQYDGENYHLFKNHGKFFYAKGNEDNLSYNLSLEEKRLIVNVLQTMVPNDNVIELVPIKIKNDNYIHLYDTTADIHMFYKKSENELELPNENIMEKLNIAFNTRTEVMLSEKEIDSSKKFFERVVKIGKKSINVLVAASIVLSLLASSDRFNFTGDNIVTHDDLIMIQQEISDLESKDIKIKLIEVLDDSLVFKDLGNNPGEDTSFSTVKLLGEKYSPYENQELSDEIVNDERLDKIFAAIDENENLTQQEKDFFKSAPDIFIDNMEYIDMDFILNKLRTLKVVYNVDLSSINAAGAYYSSNNLIEMSQKNSDAENVLSHEFCHVLCKTGDYSKYPAICEYTNAVFNNEYFGRESMELAEGYDLGYGHLSNYAHALFQILDNPELIKKFHFTQDIQLIKDELFKIVPVVGFADKLLISMNDVNTLSIYKEELKIDEETLENYKNEINKMLLTYYASKYLKEGIEDLNFYYWIDKEFVLNKVADELNLDDLDRKLFLENESHIIFEVNSDISHDLIIRKYSDIETSYQYFPFEHFNEYFSDLKPEEIEYPQMEDGTYQVPSYVSNGFVYYNLSTGEVISQITSTNSR